MDSPRARLMATGRFSRTRYLLIVSVCCLTSVSGCVATRNTSTGAILGTGLGAVTGAVIGGQSGHGTGGAIIGAATGALAGVLIGNTQDAREERDAAIAQVQFEREHAASILSNSDLVVMAQSGVTDDVIISSIISRGGRFDLSPGAIIYLKNSGVGDRVILFIQNAQASRSPIVATHGYAPSPASSTQLVFVPTYAHAHWGPAYGPRRYYGPHRYWR